MPLLLSGNGGVASGARGRSGRRPYGVRNTTSCDLGPEGGDRGGEIIVEGTPEEVCATDASFTGQHLRPFICEK